jgi:hypothetical protein
MNDAQRRKMDKIDREEAFMTDNAADFPSGSHADKWTQLINPEKAKILQFDAAQTSGFDDKRQAQEIYETRRDELVDLLEEFVLAADIVDDDIEGTAAKFKMPRPRTDQNLIAKATSFHADSDTIKTELEEAGLRAGGRGQLITIRDAFQQAALAHDSAEEHHAEATGGMNDSFRKLMQYSRRRDKSVRMKYRNNPAKLAAWTVASHLDRAPKRKKKDDENDGDNNENNQ